MIDVINSRLIHPVIKNLISRSLMLQGALMDMMFYTRKYKLLCTHFASTHTKLNIPPTFRAATLMNCICHSRRLIGILLSGGHRSSIAELSHLRSDPRLYLHTIFYDSLITVQLDGRDINIYILNCIPGPLKDRRLNRKTKHNFME